MASVGAAQRPQADPEVVSRLESEVKQLEERDQKQKMPRTKRSPRLLGKVSRLQGVEAEQHKIEQHLKGQIGSLAVALKSTLLCFHPSGSSLHLPLIWLLSGFRLLPGR